MIKYGARSKEVLNNANANLKKVFLKLEQVCPKQFDIALIESHRSVERQQLLFSRGLTKLDGITKLSEHNHFPSNAIDVYPYDAVYGVLTGHEQNIEAILKKMSPSLDPNTDALEYTKRYQRISEYIHTRFNIQAGIILATGQSVGVPLIWGGDWNSNGDTTDQKFVDLPHFQGVSYNGRA